MGRTRIYSEETATAILERMAAGETLAEICREDGMPAPGTVRYWCVMDQPAGFAVRYARARELQMEAWADAIVAISDDTAKDTHVTTYEGGVERTSPNTEWISRSRLKVDSRKWLMSKLAPNKYGDHLKVDAAVKHGVDDSVGAMMQRIGLQGKRIHDK